MAKVLALTVKNNNVASLVGEIDKVQTITIVTDNFGKKKGVEF